MIRIAAYAVYALIAIGAANYARQEGLLGRPEQFAALLAILIIGLIGLVKVTR